MPQIPIDYSKWNNIDVSDDEDEFRVARLRDVLQVGMDLQNGRGNSLIQAKPQDPPSSPPQNIVLSVKMDMFSYVIVGFVVVGVTIVRPLIKNNCARLSFFLCMIILQDAAGLVEFSFIPGRAKSATRWLLVQLHAGIPKGIKKIFRAGFVRVLQCLYQLPTGIKVVLWYGGQLCVQLVSLTVSPLSSNFCSELADYNECQQLLRADHAQLVAEALGKDYCYCPNYVNKSCCSNLKCRGEESLCTKWADPPSNASCWRCSYKWHLKRRRNQQRAVMLRILVDGEMGEGQQIETQLAEELGIEIKEIQVGRWSGKTEVLQKIKDLGLIVQNS